MAAAPIRSVQGSVSGATAPRASAGSPSWTSRARCWSSDARYWAATPSRSRARSRALISRSLRLVRTVRSSSPPAPGT